jgi:AbrB family transcriptional regulator (stage V sporulation protein T)
MKQTGIVRKIDGLGRIVIPKELRKNLRIHDSDNLEIFIDRDENIVLKKHSSLGKINRVSEHYIDSLEKIINNNIMITDNDSFIAVKGKNIGSLKGKMLSKEMVNLMEKRELYKNVDSKRLEIANNQFLEGYFFINPIIVSSDLIGMVIIFSEKEITDGEHKAGLLTSIFFQNYLGE